MPDKIKRPNIVGKGPVTDASRRENAAEHSWHSTLMSIVLMEHVIHGELDLLRVVKMLLVHDLVEIDAGDVHFFDTEQRRKQRDREARAADRLFNLLPHDQARDFLDLWNEFERRESEEARFAYTLDRLQPILLGHVTEGQTWRRHRVSRERLLSIIEPMDKPAPAISEYATSLIAAAVDKGFL